MRSPVKSGSSSTNLPLASPLSETTHFTTAVFTRRRCTPKLFTPALLVVLLALLVQFTAGPVAGAETLSDGAHRGDSLRGNSIGDDQQRAELRRMEDELRQLVEQARQEPLTEVTPLMEMEGLDVEQVRVTKPQKVSELSNGSLLYEPSDGTYENIVRLTGASLTEYAGLLDIQEASTPESIGGCAYNNSNTSQNVAMFLSVYRVSGNSPGSLLWEDTVSVNVGGNSVGCVFKDFQRQLPARVFVALTISHTLAPDFWVPVDTNGARNNTLKRRANLGSWADFQTDVRGLPLSLVIPQGGGGGGGGLEPAEDPSICMDDNDSTCLGNNRFRFDMTWTDPNDGDREKALGVTRFSDSAANAYFVNPNNLEVLFKVVEGCALNNHRWVFVGGVTNQNVRIKVADTATGRVKTYANERGTSFKTIVDTEAFLCSN